MRDRFHSLLVGCALVLIAGAANEALGQTDTIDVGVSSTGAPAEETKSALGNDAAAGDAKPEEAVGVRQSATEATPALPAERGELAYERLMKCTAWIPALRPGAENMPWGTAWVIDRDRRLIVTNQHVVFDLKQGKLFDDEHFRVYFPEYVDGELQTDYRGRLANGRYYQVKLIEVDTPRDLAVLQLDDLPDDAIALPLAKASAKPGQVVHSLGNPAASDALWVYSMGTVRQVYRAREVFPDATYDYLRVETQSPTNGGDSGGPVVNDNGELLAVTHGSTTAGQLMTRFIDVSEVRAVMETVDKLLAARTAQELNERGDHYYNRGRYDLALADYTAANRLDPQYAKPVGNRGWTWVQKGDLVTALADFNDAIKLDARDPEFYQGRAKVFIAQQEYDKALTDCVEAIRLDPKQAHAFNQRGDAYFYLEKFDQAIPDYSEAIRLKDDVAEFYNNRGACLSRLGNHEESIADYSKAIELDGTEPQYLYNRATAYQKANNPLAMLMDFVRLEQEFPEFAKSQQAHYNRRTLRVVNTTNERLQFWLKYRAWTTDGAWQWFPSEPGKENWAVYWLDPGEEAHLEHNGVRVNADRIRYWAGNAPTVKDWNRSTAQWTQYENEDLLLLPPEGEDGYFMGTFELPLK